ncbi:phosphate ABC transporter permease subunit PstC [Puniceicoccus vermicola]|uniref:Phosphate transport system permease protein n=1 Tax=Puniceicoccus vermicola TaxID=388746 RepID=A0A7X1B3U0_9BACT|nr:phosphate ABC transporter permease subunit PstC [Puniceicoccus vermicola]MBC2603900.1 phosphate ABC transporter permease subunit PstC [Puniceicoccus vermicola]
MGDKKSEFSGKSLSRSNRFQMMGLNSGDFIRYFFGGNAFVALLILGLITIFLFKEGAGFFGQYREDLKVYQRAGLQYVDIIGEQTGDYIALKQFYDKIRNDQIAIYYDEGKEFAEIKEKLADEFTFGQEFSAAGRPLERLLSEMRTIAKVTKDDYYANKSNLERRNNLIAAGKEDLAQNIPITDFTEEYWRERVAPLKAKFDEYLAITSEMEVQLAELEGEVPDATIEKFEKDVKRFRTLLPKFVEQYPVYVEKLQNWEQFEPVPMYRSVFAFLFGKRWLTGTSWQEFYGILPLLSGSFLIAVIAIAISVPFSVGAAIYVNQIATKKEQNFIKPYIEFIEALPSIVLGFFGIVVFGEVLQNLLGLEQRLNAFVAGVLLALMAVPTIFTLTEDAINNVPRAFKESSFAMGATSLQTTIRVIVPTALSGIISACLLGFGRVIGETMVVLLVAGNRIKIPDLGLGPAVIFEPVHTMTGIIAQELPEVVNGSLHYRALFMVGIVLFFIALLINFIAQKVVKRFKVSAD